jgi:flagellar motor switch protein FliM
MKSLIGDVEVGDTVVYETRPGRKEEKIAVKIRKIIYSC